MSTEPTSLPRLYTTAEAATYLRRSPRTLEDWRRWRRGPAYLPGTPTLYPEFALDEWLRNSLVSAT